LNASLVRGVEIETRGPIHEAFAEPIVFDPEPPLVAPAQPPPPIQEIPPNERPAGQFVAWIPGYWNWDEDRNAFIWLSGIWRRVPPGRQFIPGYWTETVAGYQW